uniref:Uncharacterized protein n=1 Tax=Ornithodoros erraticus TaxID=265619 RepID=A0A293MLX3_ORNER
MLPCNTRSVHYSGCKVSKRSSMKNKSDPIVVLVNDDFNINAVAAPMQLNFFMCSILAANKLTTEVILYGNKRQSYRHVAIPLSHIKQPVSRKGLQTKAFLFWVSRSTAYSSPGHWQLKAFPNVTG